jgi:hypothetical protein
MDVAPYVLFCVGCHIHVLIKGCYQAEEVLGSAVGAPARTPHPRG